MIIGGGEGSRMLDTCFEFIPLTEGENGKF